LKRREIGKGKERNKAINDRIPSLSIYVQYTLTVDFTEVRRVMLQQACLVVFD
jgi:hypothetical protein